MAQRIINSNWSQEMKIQIINMTDTEYQDWLKSTHADDQSTNNASNSTNPGGVSEMMQSVINSKKQHADGK